MITHTHILSQVSMIEKTFMRAGMVADNEKAFLRLITLCEEGGWLIFKSWHLCLYYSIYYTCIAWVWRGHTVRTGCTICSRIICTWYMVRAKNDGPETYCFVWKGLTSWHMQKVNMNCCFLSSSSTYCPGFRRYHSTQLQSPPQYLIVLTILYWIMIELI